MHRLLIISFLSLFFIQDQPTQNWNSNYRIQWEDFNGKPMDNSSAVAVTASGLSFGFSTIKSTRGQLKDYSYTLEAQFYPKKSWYLKSKVNSHILEHERLHFDITELFARKMRKRIESSSFTGNINEEMNTIYAETRKELSKMQKQYDKETQHSQNKEKQLEWQVYVKQELRKLIAYSS